MADPKKSLSHNVEGEFFVDSTCINCDTCRQLAPGVFEESDDEYSFVYAQPSSMHDGRKALRALLACPTGSIGTLGTNYAKEVMSDFPMVIEANVYYCGFASPKSFGGSSYFIKHDNGNWLIDSPKFLPQLIRRFEEMGGLSYIFLTHRDDVAEADRYARYFGARRIIHRKELSAQPDAEIILEGDQTIPLFPDFLVIPTPGHTRGHCVLLYKNTFLFSGDHLWWSRKRDRLHASEAVCWYDWSEQKHSLERLLDFEFAWVLPGHGQRVNLPAVLMRRKMRSLVDTLRFSLSLAEEY